MASGTNYQKTYGKALTAYSQGQYEEAAVLIDSLTEEFPNDPHLFLLKGHIHLGQQQYELAKQQYELVGQLTEQTDFLDCANQGLAQIRQVQSQLQIDRETLTHNQNLDSGDLAPTESLWTSDALSDYNRAEPPRENEFWAGIRDTDSDEFEEEDWEEPAPNPFAWRTNTTLQPISGFSDDQDAEFTSISSSQQTVLTFSDENDPSSESLTQLPFSQSQDNFRAEATSTSAEDNGFHREPLSQTQEFLNEFDTLNPEELETMAELNLANVSGTSPDSDWFTHPSADLSNSQDLESEMTVPLSQLETSSWLAATESLGGNWSGLPVRRAEPTVEVKQGLLAPLINAPLRKKALITAAVTGVLSAVAVLAASLSGPQPVLESNKVQAISAKVLVTLVAGVTSFGSVLILSQLSASSIKKTAQNLQSQFESIEQGKYNAKAIVYSQDELGQLAAEFNQMVRQIITTTSEVQRRAAETEQAKEDWQQQVIRLLDEVEGAASGDLTVKAEVTADVLGAVADAFNLTIQNLRAIIVQVKEAAIQVHRSAADSESFAHQQSLDALQMAEELAVTLNSVQMMTDSIKRVAQRAKETEEVARSSSETAVKGGQAVERTVAGILQIREKVSDTTRKVKRLAEASQEISQIVNTISHIASRTNLLALNASIEAARAGEAGRGFAVVADEVRQLADRIAKALQEIEQIVLRIQNETSSVMTAMEEGLQQVLDVTQRAEQAKTALDDIIKVANYIDELVRSITADTYEQRENSHTVAQVMQSVEKTAQETSQESRRVAGSLQNLVSISQELLNSVERFQIDRQEH